jgi:hypothetical protein
LIYTVNNLGREDNIVVLPTHKKKKISRTQDCISPSVSILDVSLENEEEESQLPLPKVNQETLKRATEMMNR